MKESVVSVPIQPFTQDLLQLQFKEPYYLFTVLSAANGGHDDGGGDASESFLDEVPEQIPVREADAAALDAVARQPVDSEGMSCLCTINLCSGVVSRGVMTPC